MKTLEAHPFNAVEIMMTGRSPEDFAAVVLKGIKSPCIIGILESFFGE